MLSTTSLQIVRVHLVWAAPADCHRPLCFHPTLSLNPSYATAGVSCTEWIIPHDRNLYYHVFTVSAYFAVRTMTNTALQTDKRRLLNTNE